MQKYADYIKQIEIESLWSGTKHILWNLDRRVNILSGVNGVGKSTILNKVVKGLAAGGEFPSHMIKGVHLKVEPEEAKWIRYDVIRSVDRPLMNAEMINKIDLTLVTELDWQLFQLQRKYLDYQVNIGNRIIAVLQSGEPDAAFKAQKLSEPKKLFQDMVDNLFKDTGKRKGGVRAREGREARGEDRPQEERGKAAKRRGEEVHGGPVRVSGFIGCVKGRAPCGIPAKRSAARSCGAPELQARRLRCAPRAEAPPGARRRARCGSESPPPR